MPGTPDVTIKSLATADADGICVAQAVAAAGALTLNGALVASGVGVLDSQRRILAGSSSTDVNKTLTITGTNQGGVTISEVLVLANSPTTVYTTRDFKTVTSIVASAAMSGNITVGTNGIGSSPWVVDDFTHPYWALRVGVSIASGSVNFTVDHTYDDPNAPGTTLISPPLGYSIEGQSYKPPLVWSLTALTNKAAAVESGYTDGPIFAHRLTINSGTGVAVMQSIQAGLAGY